MDLNLKYSDYWLSASKAKMILATHFSAVDAGAALGIKLLTTIPTM
jgi:hypothetical protein